jgi:hypothetical protein
MNAIKGLEELNCIKLENALLCANCEMIVNESLNGRCPVCGSGALLGVSRLLGGTLERPCPQPLLPALHSLNKQAEAGRMF